MAAGGSREQAVAAEMRRESPRDHLAG